ncbi:MAG: MFS transporter [Planctomycetota bacterium]
MNAENTDPPQAKSSRPLMIILLTVFLDLVGFSIIFPLFPDMLDYYLAKEPTGGWLHGLILQLEQLSGMEGENARLAATVLFGGLLGSLYSVLQFIAAPIWGAMSDQRGRRNILVITVAGTALSYLLWIVADAFWLLVASRFLGGIMAGNLSVATAAVADVTDASSRSKGMGMVGAAFGVGFIIGPTLGALLSLVDLTGPLGFVPGINPFSAPALVAFVMAAVNFYFVYKNFPETFVAADSGHARRPVNPLAVFQRSPFVGVNRTNLIFFLFIFAFAGMEFTLTFLAKDRFGYTAAKNGLIFLFLGFIIALVQGGMVRRLAPKYGEQRLVLIGTALVLPGLLIVGICSTQWMMYLGLLLLGVGSSLVTPCLTSLVSLYTPEDRQGETLGIFRSLGSLARAMAPLAGAALYWRMGSMWPYVGAAVLLLLPLLISSGLPKVEKA